MTKKRTRVVDAKEVEDAEAGEGVAVEDREMLEDGTGDKAKEVISLRHRLKAKAELRRKTPKRATKRCMSVFDDAGWRAVGWWKRGGKSGRGMPCDIGCDSPSQCREWKRKEVRRDKVRRDKVREDKREIEARRKARDAEIARLERERQRDETDRLQWEKFVAFESRGEVGESAP